MSSSQLNKVNHNYVRYANCWEDADVLLKALEVNENDKVLSIGSAGDNSFSLLVNNPKLVVAVDVNQVQLNLIELKKVAIQNLNYDEFLKFLGFTTCLNRLLTYETLKKHLSVIAQEYWNENALTIKNGIIYGGKFENYFSLFRTKILPLIHNKKRIDELFAQKSTKEQALFYDQKWNNKRWCLLFKIFFSKFIMGRFGRDPKFLEEVEVSVSTFILNQAKNHLSDISSQKNYFLHFILKGNFGNELPHYARKHNFEVIKQNINKLVLFKGFAEDAFKEFSNFNKFNLSNIFEYMTVEQFLIVAKNIINNAEANSRIAYWNLMVKRQISQILDEVKHETELSEKLTEQDKGFFYSKINVDVKV